MSCRVKGSTDLGVQLLNLSEKKQSQTAQEHPTVEGKIWIPTQSLGEASWVKAALAFAAP